MAQKRWNAHSPQRERQHRRSRYEDKKMPHKPPHEASQIETFSENRQEVLEASPPPSSLPLTVPLKHPLWEHPIVVGVISATISGVLVVELIPFITIWNVWIAQNASVLFVGGLAGVVAGGWTVYAVVKSKKS